MKKMFLLSILVLIASLAFSQRVIRGSKVITGQFQLNGFTITQIESDTLLSSELDTAVPTSRAVKKYIDIRDNKFRGYVNEAVDLDTVTSPVSGDIAFDSTDQVLYIRTGAAWQNISTTSKVYVAETQNDLTDENLGLVFNTTDSTLRIKDHALDDDALVPIQKQRIVATVADLDSVKAPVNSRVFVENTGAEYLKADTFELQTKQGYISPIWTGAVGDSTTNDLVKIQQAVDYTGADIIIDRKYNLGGDTLFLQDGQNIRFVKGGMLIDGFVSGNNSKNYSTKVQIFENIEILGTWTNDIGYPEWFNMSDSIQSFQATCKAGVIGETVLFTNPVYTFATTAGDVTGNSTLRNIHWRGLSDTIKIVLSTRHFTFNSYFRNNNGHNIRIENLTLETEDYQNGVFGVNNIYHLVYNIARSGFTDDMKPSSEYIEMNNVNLNGNISINFDADDFNQTIEEFSTRSIKKISFNNVNSNYGWSTIGVSNIPTINAEFRNCTWRNILDDPISFPISGPDPEYIDYIAQNQGKLIIDKCTFVNDTVMTAIPFFTPSPTVSKAFDEFIFTNNTVKDLIVTGDVSGQVNTFYATGPYNYAEGNEFINVIGLNDAGNSNQCRVVKIRGGIKNVFKNNTFTWDRTGLVKLGIIDSLTQDIATIPPDSFSIELIEYGGQGEPFNKSLIFEGNTINVPTINRSTQIYANKEFIWKDNSINIEHWGTSSETSISKANTLWYHKERIQRSDTSTIATFESTGNTWSIGNFENDYWDFYKVNNGVQVGSIGNPDTVFNHSSVLIDDVFFVDSIKMGFELLDAKRQKIKADIIGNDNSYEIRNYSSSSNQRPNVSKFSSDVTLSDIGQPSEEGVLVWSPDGTQEVEFENVNVDSIIVFNFLSSMSLYDIRDELPIIANIEATYRDTFGEGGSVEYRILFDSLFRSVYFYDETNNIANGFSPHSGTPIEIGSYPRNFAPFNFIMSPATNSNWYLNNTGGLKYLKLKATFKNRPGALSDSENNDYVDLPNDYKIKGDVGNGRKLTVENPVTTSEDNLQNSLDSLFANSSGYTPPTYTTGQIPYGDGDAVFSQTVRLTYQNWLLKITGVNDLVTASSIMIENASGNTLLRSYNNGRLRWGNVNIDPINSVGTVDVSSQGTGLLFESLRSPAGSAGKGYIFRRSSTVGFGGTENVMTIDGSFTPSASTHNRNYLNIEGTINQTGTASGLTRGIYINPTLTSAIDYRPIDIASGKGTPTIADMSNASFGTYDSNGKMEKGFWSDVPADSLGLVLVNDGDGTASTASGIGRVDILDTLAVARDHGLQIGATGDTPTGIIKYELSSNYLKGYGTADWNIGSETNGIAFHVDNNNRNIGIRTAIPSEALEVNGNAKADSLFIDGANYGRVGTDAEGKLVEKPFADFATATVGTYNAVEANTAIYISASGGATTVNLLQGSEMGGRTITLIRLDNNPGTTVTVTASSGSIFGSAGVGAELANQYSTVTLLSDGASYYVTAINTN